MGNSTLYKICCKVIGETTRDVDTANGHGFTYKEAQDSLRTILNTIFTDSSSYDYYNDKIYQELYGNNNGDESNEPPFDYEGEGWYHGCGLEISKKEIDSEKFDRFFFHNKIFFIKKFN